ncbi:MAG: metallophosphoesterase [Verrucomicrobiota bacterium]|jgi:hypothetical protein
MPIYLPPISRRAFLGRTAVAGAALGLAPGLLATSRSTDGDSWALLADTHIAGDRAAMARGINMSEHLVRVTRELLALPKRPAGVFITGDGAYLTGEKADYARLVELLEPIRKDKVPIHIALGNHDQRQRFRQALAMDRGPKRAPADKQVALVGTARANWFVLDSLDQTNATPGLLGQEQLDWLAQALDANRQKPALLLVHHNPGTSQNITGLKDTGALLEVIRPRKQVKAYLFGHTHVWKVQPDPSGIHLVNLPPVAYIFHQGDPAGWVRATLEDHGLRLELRCLDPTHKAHGQVVHLEWRA